MTDYYTMPTDLAGLHSPALRGIAGEVASLTMSMTVHHEQTGKHIADAILYLALEDDHHYTLALDDRGVPIFYSLDATRDDTITDDDLADSINDFVTCWELMIPYDL